MDWPHDPDGDDGSEGGRKYGLAILAKKLDDDDFPLSKSASLEAVGDHPIRLDAEVVVPASDLLEAMDEGPFETRMEWLAAAADSMRTAGYWTFDGEHSG